MRWLSYHEGSNCLASLQDAFSLKYTENHTHTLIPSIPVSLLFNMSEMERQFFMLRLKNSCFQSHSAVVFAHYTLEIGKKIISLMWVYF